MKLIISLFVIISLIQSYNSQYIFRPLDAELDYGFIYETGFCHREAVLEPMPALYNAIYDCKVEDEKPSFSIYTTEDPCPKEPEFEDFSDCLGCECLDSIEDYRLLEIYTDEKCETLSFRFKVIEDQCIDIVNTAIKLNIDGGKYSATIYDSCETADTDDNTGDKMEGNLNDCNEFGLFYYKVRIATDEASDDAADEVTDETPTDDKTSGSLKFIANSAIFMIASFLVAIFI